MKGVPVDDTMTVIDTDVVEMVIRIFFCFVSIAIYEDKYVICKSR